MTLYRCFFYAYSAYYRCFFYAYVNLYRRNYYASLKYLRINTNTKVKYLKEAPRKIRRQIENTEQPEERTSSTIFFSCHSYQKT